MVGRSLPRTFLPVLFFLALGAAFSFYVAGNYTLPENPVRSDPKAIGALVFIALALAGLCLPFLEGLFPTIAFPDSIRILALLAMAVTAFCVGLVLGSMKADHPGSMPHWAMQRDEVSRILVRLAEDPRKLASGSHLLKVELLESETSAGLRVSASGRCTVFISTKETYAAGDTLYLKGSVQVGVTDEVFRAKEAFIIKKAGPLMLFRHRIRSAIIRRMETRHWGGLASALLLGTKDGLESGESDLYVKAGCAHVLALSGMHLAVISALISLVLKRALGLRKSAVIGVVMVAAYVYLAGSQASLVRAGLMYAIAACAVLGGYPRRVLLILAFAFLIQLTLDPLAARSLSFILSYLALAGIAVLSPSVDELLRGMLPGCIRSPVAASVGAFLATAAVSVAFFGVLRPIGLLAGMILAPAATVVMVGAMSWLVLDVIWAPLGFIVDKGLDLVSLLSHELVSLAARVPGVEIGNATLVVCISLAACALLLYLQRYRNMTRNRLEPFA